MFGRIVLENFADIPVEKKRTIIIKDFTQHPPCMVVSSDIEIDNFRS